MNIAQLVNKQKEFLRSYLQEEVVELARNCGNNIDDIDALNNLLLGCIQYSKYITLGYVVDCNAKQLSANVKSKEILTRFQGQDLSQRPFFNLINVKNSFYLSDAYISTADFKPCISATQAIFHNNKILGMLVLDFDLESLPLPMQNMDADVFTQIKGDPEIRSNLFNQHRVSSAMDESIDTVHNIANELICELGVFHLKLHYAASRATVWTYKEPYCYKVHVLDEIISPNICLLYPKTEYPKEAKVSPQEVKEVLEKFTYMRFMDESLYLKTGSINIMNSMVGLSFSCDGNHYLTVKDFLANFNQRYGD
ncbi:hypothetical protein SPBRAN_946 [uncultured Candidatus Thioglobus sp.]|nr:hypothetical protein SPBRAN_946 [uncultured Candidatus Thioglobus sp.]